MKNILRASFLLLFILFAASYSLGEGEKTAKKEELITIYKGEIRIVAVDNPTRVVINNPAIADITSVSKEDMIIVAKEQGTTSLVWWDSKGQHIAELSVFLENMSPAKGRIDSLLKEMNLTSVYTRNMDSEGKVLLLGNVKTSQEIERINVALSPLKGKIINLIQVKEEETVIGIDVQVLELDKDATNTLGFSWPGSVTLTERGSVGIDTATGSKWSTLFKVAKLSRDAFTFTLDALVQEGKARILSQPKLACQSGKEAELLVGGEKPILTTTIASTSGAGGTNVDYKEFGIKLKIKPIVTEDKKIKLALNVEVSEVGVAETLGAANSPTARAYPLTKRNASTELFLSDGQTMAIGGLKKQKSEEEIRKTPFLGDLPFIGLAFRKKTTRRGGGQGERGDVELFITLTPTILKETGIKKEEVKLEAPGPKEEKLTKEATPAVKGGMKKEEVKPKAEAAPAAKPDTTKVVLGKETSKFRKPYTKARIEPTTEYVRKVSQQIRQNFAYPWAAKEANIEGSVTLGLRLYYTGELLDVEVRKSSGYAVLDENSVNIVKKTAPYPPFPAEMKQKELHIDLPVVYKTE